MTAPGAPAPVRILVVEDNLLARTGVVTLIRTQPDLEVVGEAGDGARAISSFRELNPDVTMVDLRLPVFDGVQTIQAIRREFPTARILVLSHYDGDEDVFQAMNAGALGYISKEVDGDDLFLAIRTVAAGRRYLSHSLAQQMAERALQPALSPREVQVLEEAAKGLTNREIAQALSITERTAGVYVSHILSKLGAKSRTEAVAIGRQRGFIKVK